MSWRTFYQINLFVPKDFYKAQCKCEVKPTEIFVLSRIVIEHFLIKFLDWQEQWHAQLEPDLPSGEEIAFFRLMRLLYEQQLTNKRAGYFYWHITLPLFHIACIAIVTTGALLHLGRTVVTFNQWEKRILGYWPMRGRKTQKYRNMTLNKD